MLLRAEVAADYCIQVQTPDDEHRPILTPPVVFDIRHPGPNHFAWVWVTIWVWCVFQTQSLEVLRQNVAGAARTKLSGAPLGVFPAIS